MGNTSAKTEKDKDNVKSPTLGNSPIKPILPTINDYKHIEVLGRGGYGKIWKVMKKKTKQYYALKEMSKAKVITKKSIDSVMNERQLLSQINHPFFVNMICAFQDRENLYLLLDLMPGGDFRYHLFRNKRFTEEQTKFFVACIVTGLEFLHSNSILHRDIKPENLVFDDKNYLRIADFGISSIWRPENSEDTSGTPGYMAPEVMCRQNHGVAVDYYAIGIIAYECMFGRRPFTGRTRKELRDQILARQVQIKKDEVPKGWSLEAADFINKLIQRKAANRLGYDGPSEVKNHPWFKGFPWQTLLNKAMPPLFIANGDNFEFKEEIEKNNPENDDALKQNAILLRRKSVQGLFEGYDHQANNTNAVLTESTCSVVHTLN